jgi:hypothetical protein
MADSTTFHGDTFLRSDRPRRRRSGESVDIDALRERVRDLGADLKRNWIDAQPALPAEMRPASPAVRPRPAPPPPAPAWPEPERRDPPQRMSAAYEPAPAKPVPAAKRPQAPVAEAPAMDGDAANALLAFLSAHRGLALKSLLGVLLALATAGVLRDWPAPAAAPVAPPVAAAAWIDIAKPYPLFDLVAPSLGHGQPVYTARRHAAGGGREDVLTFGQFGGAKTFLRIGVYRHGGEEVADSIYFVDMARRAAASGLGVTEADLPQAMPTRFGDFESGAVELSGSENVKRRNCRGFRRVIANPALTLGGFMCGAGEEKVGAADLACVIDRLGLLAAGQDRELADFFGAAGGRKGRACAESGRRK